MTQYPKVLPFKGLLYNTQKIPDLSKVVTPPYDVISPEMQAAFYDKHPNNFVKIDFSREPEGVRYEEAGKIYHDWVRRGVFARDEKPAFYFHEHTFTLPDGKKMVRKGFFGARRIEDFSEGGVKPHEKTLEGPKADRLKLTQAVGANLSPVFSLYSDKERKIDHLVAKLKEKLPFISFKTDEGEEHRIWREDNSVVCKLISEVLDAKEVFIADGHHRYETGLNYRNECRKKFAPGDGLEAFNYGLMYFSSMDDEGLVILPIHRAVHGLSLHLGDLLEILEKHFHVQQLKDASQEEIVERLARAGQESHTFALVTKDPKETYLVSLGRGQWKHSAYVSTMSPSLVGLDVVVLHRLVFEELLRMTPEAQAKQENLIYWKDTKKAIFETRSGNCQFTFLLNPTRIEDMRRVASSGEKMPQKSTYFYPKILSGLVINPLNPEEKLGF